MPVFRHTSRLPLLAALLLLPACRGGADIGERCDTVADCADGLQCLGHTCVPRCSRHTDCGDGYLCRADGVCEIQDTRIGENCDREVDCGPGQSCQLQAQDHDGDGFLTSTCQAEHVGGVLDATCTVAADADDPVAAAAAADAQCRTGTCVLGRCVDQCSGQSAAGDLDCPATHRCSSIPRELPRDTPPSEVASFYGCLPARGDIVYHVPTSNPYEAFYLPVPGLARSLAMIATIDDPTQLVGVTEIRSPSGELLHMLPHDRDEYFANPVRLEPMPAMLTLAMPQSLPETPDPLEDGAYHVELGSLRDLDGTAGTEVPSVDIVYKLDDAIVLDLHFYFLNLDHHPCADQLGAAVFDAAAARESPGFQDVFLRELNLTFSNAGIVLDREGASYRDLRERPDLDGLDASRLGELLPLSTEAGGISIFFVRTLSPAGLQALVGGPPGPAGRAGTSTSGVVIGVDTLCYRSWDQLARITAHEIARSLGLHRSVEPDGFEDPITDSGHGTDNLMYFSEFGSDILSDNQKVILRLSPALR